MRPLVNIIGSCLRGKPAHRSITSPQKMLFFNLKQSSKVPCAHSKAFSCEPFNTQLSTLLRARFNSVARFICLHIASSF